MMDWNDGWGMGSWGMGGWLFLGLGMILFWGLVAYGLVTLLRPRVTGRPEQPPTADPGTSTALHTLDERFARGELDEEEYRRRRDLLRGH